MKNASLSILFSFLYVMAFATGDDSTSHSDSAKRVDAMIESMSLSPHNQADTTLLVFAYDWLGVDYCYGGMGRSGVDCSGFAKLVYLNVYGIQLPRVSTDIYRQSEKVKRKYLQQGDLVFFKTLGRSRVNHVGVYLWDGYFIHASTKHGVIISKLNEGYYERTFVSGGRY